MGKGVRQGDPLSLYLYVIIAEALHLMFQVVSYQGWSHGFRIGQSHIVISHLQYADDSILFLKEDEEELKTVWVVLKWFEICSGLRINLRKVN